MDFAQDDAFVDADDAVFEGLGDAPDAADVAAVEIHSLPRERGRVRVGVSLAILTRKNRLRPSRTPCSACFIRSRSGIANSFKNKRPR